MVTVPTVKYYFHLKNDIQEHQWSLLAITNALPSLSNESVVSEGVRQL